QMQCCLLGFLSSGGYVHRRLVNSSNQNPQLVNGVVNRVGDGASEIFGYCRGGGQITIGEVSQLIQKAQNRSLITLIGLVGNSQSMICTQEEQDADYRKTNNN